jgi:hypothetical protein
MDLNSFLFQSLPELNESVDIIVRFLINTIVIFIAVHFIYAKSSRRKDFYFSYLAIGVVVFFLCFLLNSVKLELGFALGLFAIFGIIRYRTDAIPIKEMTYLFIIIGISVVNALTSTNSSFFVPIFTNIFIIGGLWLLEKSLMPKNEQSLLLIYEKIENIHKEKEAILLKDLYNRTGIIINHYQIQKIDYLRDIAEIMLYFNGNGAKNRK